MSIPIELLKLTESRAPGMAVYGGPGLKKTYAIHSCPWFIQLHDFEGGTAPLIPWVRKRRRWNATSWQVITQEERLAAWTLLPLQLQLDAAIKPNPLIDIISYDVFDAGSYDHFIANIGNFDAASYNTWACDSLQELSVEVQSFSKKQKGLQVLDAAPEGHMPWGAIQERTAIALRRVRSFRDEGVFVYMIGSEVIDKDYVTDPRSKQKGEQQEQPYSVKGTINLPGKMASTVPHLVDILAHARPLNGEPRFVTKQEPLPGGAAHWEAKDRFGRLDDYMLPNIRSFFEKIYGIEQTKLIYKSAQGGQVATQQSV